MSPRTLDHIRQDLRARTPRHSLSQAYYTDPDIFAHERAQIFHRHWIFACMESELAEPGAFRTLDIAGAPLVIVRTRGGTLNAFHNTCRHRGSLICDQAHGVRPLLVCPYHHWSYDLDGHLVRAPHQPATLDKSARALAPAYVTAIAGYVFVCVGESAPDITPLRNALSPAAAPHALASAKLVAQIELVEAANWKLVWENSRECDHCPGGGHTALMKTLRIFNFADPAGDPEIAAFWQKCEAAGLPSRTIDGPGFRIGRIPLHPGCDTISADGRLLVSRNLGDLPDMEMGSLRWTHYPGVLSHVHRDYAIVLQVLPVDARTTRVICRWLVHPAALEGRDYDLEKLRYVWERTNDEDRVFAERNQRGVESPAYRPGPYADPSECLLWQFIDWYADALGAPALTP